MTRYLFSSHDGFGVGHVRRNTLIARAVLAREPDAQIGIITGLAVRPSWLGDPRMQVIHVPGLVKDSQGSYQNDTYSFEEALERRAGIFRETVDSFAPDVIVVDRHPYGIGGELRDGLELGSRRGAALVLGLRDIIDEADRVAEELAGPEWVDLGEMYDEVLIYGERHLCDHQEEYGLSVTPQYCGWIADTALPVQRDPDLLVVTGGGGGDGEEVFMLGAELSELLPQMRTVLVAGPYATHQSLASFAPNRSGSAPGDRLTLVRDVAGCAELFARAAGVVQMAGYNSTFEALAAGVRPVLVPRRSPRREQAIRAGRLASLGLADVVDERVPASEVAWLLSRPRLLLAGALEHAGIRLDGHLRAARAVTTLAGVRVP
jgi:predicted glycosyltransferase